MEATAVLGSKSCPVLSLQCSPAHTPYIAFPQTSGSQLAFTPLGILMPVKLFCDSCSGWARGRTQAGLAVTLEQGPLPPHAPQSFICHLRVQGTDRLRRRPLVRKAFRLQHQGQPCIYLLAQPLGIYPWGLAGLLGIPSMRMCVPGQEEVNGVGWRVEHSRSTGEQQTLSGKTRGRERWLACYFLCSTFPLPFPISSLPP